MTRYSNKLKKAGQYLAGLNEHWRDRRAAIRRNRPLPKRGVVLNDCWRPSLPQTKADLRDLHRDKMRGKGYGSVRRRKARGDAR